MARKQFSVHQPTTLERALDMLVEHRVSVRVLAGGTDLVPKLKARGLDARHLVSLRHIPGLDNVSFTDPDGLVIGATARLSQVADTPAVQAQYPGLAHACSVMATTQIRNMGTVAGNLANAAPSADTACPLLVYDASVKVVGPNGRRQIKLADFFKGPGVTVLEPVEIIEAITVPVPPRPSGSAYERLSARSKVDIAAVAVAGFVGLGSDGCVNSCRLALASVAPTPLPCHDAEAMMMGQTVDDDLLVRVADACMNAAKPIDDVRSSADYRRRMVQVLSLRVLQQCVARAKGGAL